jgi:hypothetical protein
VSLAYVFGGPSFSSSSAVPDNGVVLLPPAALGDVLKVVNQRPLIIGIIDGYFEWTRAVWHKEILWAMARGVHVYGSASMGALRAAELADFGMRGFGLVYEEVRSGRLRDDDEVAVMHGPAELGYRPLTEAMVNVRRTLDKAAASQVLDFGSADIVVQAAKKMFYKQRTYPDVLRMAVRKGLRRRIAADLANWLPHNRVDQKNLDAMALIDVISADIKSDLQPMCVSYRFNRTTLWEKVLREHCLASDLRRPKKAP